MELYRLFILNEEPRSMFWYGVELFLVSQFMAAVGVLLLIAYLRGVHPLLLLQAFLWP